LRIMRSRRGRPGLVPTHHVGAHGRRPLHRVRRPLPWRVWRPAGQLGSTPPAHSAARRRL